MHVSVDIGQNHPYSLTEALLIYKSKQDPYSNRESSFITHHAIREPEDSKIPVLGPAKPLTIDFVQTLVRSRGGHIAVEYLPNNVIARTEQVIAWWSRPQRRLMRFGDTQGNMIGISGKVFPQPAPLWMVCQQLLFVRALKDNRRPEPGSKLCFAPYWHTYENGGVCPGSMRRPSTATVATVEKWEQGFFDSAFTHGNAERWDDPEV